MRPVAILMLPIVALTASCGAPVETRIQTQASTAATAQKSYRFAAQPEQNSEIYGMARKLVADALAGKGFADADEAPILVQIALAARPASIAMTTGEEDDLRTLAAQKERKPLQSCEDVEHRLTINMTRASDGSTLYSGTAAEYHCKGTVEQSLPHLVKGALMDLGRSSPENNIVTRTRAGIE